MCYWIILSKEWSSHLKAVMEVTNIPLSLVYIGNFLKAKMPALVTRDSHYCTCLGHHGRRNTNRNDTNWQGKLRRWDIIDVFTNTLCQCKWAFSLIIDIKEYIHCSFVWPACLVLVHSYVVSHHLVVAPQLGAKEQFYCNVCHITLSSNCEA